MRHSRAINPHGRGLRIESCTRPVADGFEPARGDALAAPFASPAVAPTPALCGGRRRQPLYRQSDYNRRPVGCVAAALPPPNHVVYGTGAAPPSAAAATAQV
ncbi:hypothetical protein EVAR_68418_1 [Eumeta japonica]|uniref:Uncharacterized protein n=1 Tax=Eumeta variegata TaxID=151549 RepID=A0A4C1ZRD8_EUMVA|nr:hypothetical protein EVAR_68418_1 [Eumeta japonica]